MSSIQILGPLRFHSKFSRRRSNMPLKGHQTPLKALLRGGGRYLSLSLESRLEIFFFDFIENNFEIINNLKSCLLFLSFNNSWGLGRGSGKDLCVNCCFWERGRGERVYVMWVPALSGRWVRFQRAMPRTKLTGSEIRGHYTLSTRLSMNNATRNRPVGAGKLVGWKFQTIIFGLLLVVDRRRE